KPEEYMAILPYGWRTDVSDSTKIDLPLVGAPHCRFEMKGRCLFALNHPEYPYQALKMQASGTVTLAATITRAGKTASVRIEGTSLTPGASERLLIDAAIRNLSSWQLEPSEG